MRVVTCPGIVLRSHPYSETSRVLRILTPDFGVLSLMARGVRRRRGGGLESLSEGTFTFHHREDRDLHTMTDVESGANSLALGRDLRRFVGASLVGELLLVHALEEECSELYEWVRGALQRIGKEPASEVPGWILASSWRTLALLGFPPELGNCVGCGAVLEEPAPGVWWRFDASAGGIRCVDCGRGSSLPRIGPGARNDLAALVRGEPPVPLAGQRAHLRILEGFAYYHLAPGKGFKSFRMLEPLLEEDGEG
jgi:DNA repair protein RecO (recombination protein O)